jgi:predicted O-methyltransferase YrrM
MNPIQIGRKRLSEIVWGIIDEKVGDFPFEAVEKIVEDQQELRSQADYNTGSLPYDDAIELYKVVRFFQPKVIAEVGTFIGVSTMVMDLATKNAAQIRTCDVSNRIDLAHFGNIEQYFQTPSHEMFADMAEKEVKADLIYLDGRLGQDDFEPLSKIIHDKTVFVMDDFEGTEKGVANAMMVESPDRVLIYPREGRKTAFSVPFSLLQIVSQEAT